MSSFNHPLDGVQPLPNGVQQTSESTQPFSSLPAAHRPDLSVDSIAKMDGAADSPGVRPRLEPPRDKQSPPNTSSYLYRSLGKLAHTAMSTMISRKEDDMRKITTTLEKRQHKIFELYNLLQAINKAADADGALDLSNQGEVKELLQKAGDCGVEIQDGKEIFNREEKNRLVDNIRMTVDDLNTQNETDMQKITKMQNEIDEMYKVQKSVLKTLHDAIMACAKAIRGG